MLLVRAVPGAAACPLVATSSGSCAPAVRSRAPAPEFVEFGGELLDITNWSRLRGKNPFARGNPATRRRWQVPIDALSDHGGDRCLPLFSDGAQALVLLLVEE